MLQRHEHIRRRSAARRSSTSELSQQARPQPLPSQMQYHQARSMLEPTKRYLRVKHRWLQTMRPPHLRKLPLYLDSIRALLQDQLHGGLSTVLQILSLSVYRTGRSLLLYFQHGRMRSLKHNLVHLAPRQARQRQDPKISSRAKVRATYRRSASVARPYRVLQDKAKEQDGDPGWAAI